MAKAIKYQEMVEQASTGDLLLFNTRNHWFDGIIEKFSHSKFSHIGIILRNPTFIDPKLDQGLYLLESSWEGRPDSVEGKFILGVQIVPLEQTIKDFKKSTNNGYLYYRKLACDRNGDFEKRLLQAYQVAYGKPYDLLPQDWIKAEFDIEVGEIQRTSTFWCSALVGYVFVKLGFLEKDIPWTLLAPKQFSSYEKDQLPFLEGCQLTPERYVVFE